MLKVVYETGLWEFVAVISPLLNDKQLPHITSQAIHLVLAFQNYIEATHRNMHSFCPKSNCN